MFKFYSIPNLEVLESILGKNPLIRFASAYNLNDPFELKFNLSINPNAKGHKEEFFKTHKDGTLKEFNSKYKNEWWFQQKKHEEK